MKVTSPCLLALLLAISATPVVADVIGSGVYYDVGKASYSDNPTISDKGVETDSMLCWAITGSNMVQYWQDTYVGHADNPEDTPNGVTSSTSNNPYGTRYLNVYEQVLSSAKMDKGGDISSFFDWWFKGDAPQADSEGNESLSQMTGYYNLMYNGQDTYTTNDSVSDMSSFIVEKLSVQGASIGLDIAGNCAHAITCWGYEIDQDGNLSALILSDGDDKYFGTYRVEVQRENVKYEFDSTNPQPASEKWVIITDDRHEYYGYGYNYIDKATAIFTPERYTNSGGEDVDLATNSAVSAGSILAENTKLWEDTTVEGAGITVGDGKNVVVMTADSAVNLSLVGNSSESVGLTVAAGGMASLSNLSVSGYKQGGLNLVGKTYLHDGNVTIADNKSTNSSGGAIVNKSYLEISNGGDILILENTADNGQGGAIYNAANADISIRGNGNVIFMSNAAKEGNDIYNAEGGTINIADNEAVNFYGNGGSAIVNKGSLYLSAEAGKSIDFRNASIDSKGGTTYIGRDSNGRSVDNTGSVNFYSVTHGEGAVTTIKAAKTSGNQRYNEQNEFIVYAFPQFQPEIIEIISAAFDNVTMSVDAIAGVSADTSSMKYADIDTSAALTLSNLTMDTTSSITAEGANEITLSQVTITLTDADISEMSTADVFIFDLTDMLVGNFSFDDVLMDLSGVTTLSNQSIEIDFGSAYATNQVISTTSGLFVTYSFADTPYTAVPEPTTATLSLLALAGLAARRRRR